MEKEKFLKTVWENLNELKQRCSNTLDIRKDWVFSIDEIEAIDKVIDAVADCRENGIGNIETLDVNIDK